MGEASQNMEDIFFQYEFVKQNGDELKLILKGPMDHTCAERSYKTLLKHLNSVKPKTLFVDLSMVTKMEDFGLVLLAEIKRRSREWRGDVKLQNISHDLAEIFKSTPLDTIERPKITHVETEPGILVRLGEAVLRYLDELRYLISFAGSVLIAFFYTIRHRGSVKEGEIVKAIHRVGIDAIPIISLLSLLLGLIVAFMSSVQLKQFGANIYVASLVALSMVRELGPIITAIIVGGRSGSSFAAEIASMKIDEEVDALVTMGFQPTRFLVVPKLIATMVAMPILTLLSEIFAIFGGLIVGIFMLDLTMSAYLVETVNILTPFDMAWSLFKSITFAVLITWIGCFRGFQAQGGADSVGRATTSAVVSSIFLIIVVDSVFAVIMTYWG